jgi:pimeloyl-ACP methyl ester carboxylesterase
MTLGDGRRLAYLELGDEGGRPLVYHHGGLSSSIDAVPADRHAARAGIRLVAPDRPGIGGSEAQQDRTMRGWAADVAELADHLGLESFSTMGWSFGGAFAASVAHELAERVDALVLVASAIPADWDGAAAQINAMDRRFLELSRRGPTRAAERCLLALMSATVRVAPDAFARRGGLPAADAHDLTEAIRAGLSDRSAVVKEYQLLDKPWGFDPSELTVDTRIWQGDADDLVPCEWGQRLHDAIEGSHLHLVEGATHFLAYDRWAEIFEDLSPH